LPTQLPQVSSHSHQAQGMSKPDSQQQTEDRTAMQPLCSLSLHIVLRLQIGFSRLRSVFCVSGHERPRPTKAGSSPEYARSWLLEQTHKTEWTVTPQQIYAQDRHTPCLRPAERTAIKHGNGDAHVRRSEHVPHRSETAYVSELIGWKRATVPELFLISKKQVGL
jgi:hypothetical protein